MEQNNKKKKSRFEEWVNADNRNDMEETTSGVIIPMDTDVPGIDPCTKMIPTDMVLTYASYYDNHRKSNSNSDYEPKDDDENFGGAKELTGSTYIYYALPEAKILFAVRLGKTAYYSTV